MLQLNLGNSPPELGWIHMVDHRKLHQLGCNRRPHSDGVGNGIRRDPCYDSKEGNNGHKSFVELYYPPVIQ